MAPYWSANKNRNCRPATLGAIMSGRLTMRRNQFRPRMFWLITT